MIFKDLVQSLSRKFGYQFRKLPHLRTGTGRPVGDMGCFLEDIAARGFRPESILDVGANEGHWSRVAAKVFPGANFLLIEPQREMKSHLDQFCREQTHARWIEAGVGAEKGELVLTIWDDLQGSSFLANSDPVHSKGKEKRTVEILTIDSLYKGQKPPQLAKLDIQGFELEALKGAKSLFGVTELFILEVSLYEFLPSSPVVSEVVAFMAARGYEVYDIPGFARRPFDSALGQVDLAFARKGGFLMARTDW